MLTSVKAKYNNGKIEWIEKPPLTTADIVVVFSVEQEQERPVRQEMTTEEALRILNKYAGSIDRDFDYEKEKDEYFDEKYGSFNWHKVVEALINEAWDDLEDGLQIECVYEVNADYIITRDPKGFVSSNVKSLSPKDFMNLYEKDALSWN